jgi:hypothetical protein
VANFFGRGGLRPNEKGNARRLAFAQFLWDTGGRIAANLKRNKKIE